MADAAEGASKPQVSAAPSEEPVAQSPMAVLVACVRSLEVAVRQEETRATFHRVLRRLGSIRRRLSREVLEEFVQGTFDDEYSAPLLQALAEVR